MAWEHVQGVDEAIRALLELPAKMEANVVRGGLRAMARTLQLAILPAVPVGKGISHKGASANLAGTLRISSFRGDGMQHVALKIGSRRAGVFYAGMVQGGTRPHLIRVRYAKDLVLGRGIFRKEVMHPGARPNPFMRQGFDRERETAVRTGFAYVTERLQQMFRQQGAA